MMHVGSVITMLVVCKEQHKNTTNNILVIIVENFSGKIIFLFQFT